VRAATETSKDLQLDLGFCKLEFPPDH